MRVVLKNEAAKTFYEAATKNDKYTQFGKSFARIGGYFYSEIPGIYVSYDFDNGQEVFVEDFDNIDHAIEYASGGDTERTYYGVFI